MKTVLCVIGTRPEAIKMAPVVQELYARNDQFQCTVCSTGQHREMLNQALNLFGIVPDYALDVMQPNQSLSALTAALISGLDRVVATVQPQWLLVQGDTTTVLAASLVGFYHRCRIGHVEAGLRTQDRHIPFPEEMNRRLADNLSDRFFCPTARAATTLLAEGYPTQSVLVTGNTVIDALLSVAALPYNWQTGPLSSVDPDREILMVTAHRRESFGKPFEELCAAIRDTALQFPQLQIVYPVHLNPNVRKPVDEILSGLANVVLLPPLDYLSLVQLMKRSKLVLTDSGGIQEEAPGLGKPVLVMRETTERPEGVEAGVVRLVGTSRARIAEETALLLTNSDAYQAMARGSNPYGDGKAAGRIVDSLERD